jgi:general secretion pathway protein D
MRPITYFILLAFLAYMHSLPCCATAQRASADVTEPGKISLHFKAEAGKILSVLAQQWHINIIIPEEIKTVITVDLSNVTVQRAIQIVAAKSGALYRRINADYVVATAEKMPGILETLGQEERVTLKEIASADAILQLKTAIPLVTARPFGHAITLIGAPSDLLRARQLLREIDVPTSLEPTDSISLTLKHAPVADIQQLLTTQFPHIKAQKVGENVIAITGKAEDVAHVQEFVRGLDQAGDADSKYVVYQIKYGSARALAATLQRVTARVTVVVGPEPYHIPTNTVNLSTSSALGSSGQSSASGTGSSGVITSSGDLSSTGSGSNDTGTNAIGATNAQSGGERATSLILGGSEENIQAALKLLVSIDIPVPQVILDVKVVSTNPQTVESLGIDWSNGGQGEAASVSTTVTQTPNGNSLFTGQLSRLPISFSATLNAFFRRDDVRIEAKPTITALNNETGIVFVGETRRVQVASIVPNSGANNVILNNVQEIPVGISLQMRPRVNGNDEITLFLHPVYSTGGATDPNTGLFDTFQREAETTVRVKSGETLVIGGLLQDEDTKTLIKIPLLGDLPLIGQLFRNHSRTHLRREVLVFVTPHLINN